MRHRTMAASAILAIVIITVFGGPPVQAEAPPSGRADQTAADFQKALGVPLEDAGGGTHAVLLQKAEAARTSLVAAGYMVNQIRLNFDPMSADIFIAYTAPTEADKGAALSAADGATINFVTVRRSAAEGEALQARIDADSPALAQRGIIICTTGIVDDGATILVTLINGTPAQADYILKRYGPDGLKVSIATGPIPWES